jgi:hypothetical protein
MKGVLPKRLALVIVAAVNFFAAALPAMAQGCPLCYTQAASAGARMIQALRSGILILIVPPTLMSVGMILILYRKRNQIRKTALQEEADAIWNTTSLSSPATTLWPPPAP